MQRVTVTNDLTNYDTSRSLLNLMTSFWFTKTKAKIDRSSNTKRKKKWAKLDPFEMNILIPTLTSGQYYLVDRPAGLLLAHAPVPSLTWARFFAWLKKRNPPGDWPNSAVQALVEQGVTLDRVNAALDDETTLSGTPTTWKTVDENQDDVILVTGKPLSDEDIVDLIQTQFFQNYHFQSAVYSYNPVPDEDKPVYYTATLALKDEAFPENDRSRTLYVVNLGQFESVDDPGEETGTDDSTGESDPTQDESSATDTPT